VQVDRRQLTHFLTFFLLIQELVTEAEKFKPVTEEVKSLARPVLAYLAAFTEAPARSLEDRLEKLQKSVES